MAQPKDQKAASNQSQMQTHLDMSQATSSTTSEKAHLIELRFQKGELIEYGYANKKRYAIKTGPNSFIDAESRRMVPGSEIMSYLGDPTLSKTINYNEYRAKNTSIGKKLMFGNKDHVLSIDFETTIKGKEAFQAGDHFSTGLTDIISDGKGTQILRGREYYSTDIFDLMLSSDEQKRASGYGKFSNMSKNVKAGYFKQIDKLANKKGLDLGSTWSKVGSKDPALALHQLVNDRKRLQKVQSSIIGMEMLDGDDIPKYKAVAKSLGVSRTNIQAGLGRDVDIARELNSEFKIGEATSPTMIAFNPGGVDDRNLKYLMDKIGKGGDAAKLSMKDIRGNQMLINSTLMPQLTENAHVALGPEMNDIAHRLNMTKKQRAVFFENAKGGIAGFYNKATSAEDFEKNLRYATGRDKVLTFNKTVHTAGLDAAKELQMHEMQKDFITKTLKQRLNPNLHMHNPTARFQGAWVADMAINAMKEDQFVIDSNNPGVWKKHFTGEFNRKVDINKLSKTIQAKTERAYSHKIEKTMLKSNIKQFGGSTVAHLLGGAMLFAGVRAAASKAQEMFTPNRQNSTEGIRHESIMTTVRRLSMTDFGSGRLSGISPAMMKMFGKLFKAKINDPSGMGMIVKDSLTKIGETIKATANKRGQTSVIGFLKDPDAVHDVINSVLGTAVEGQKGTPGLVQQLGSKLYSKGHISKEVQDKLGAITLWAEGKAATYQQTMNSIATQGKGATASKIGKQLGDNISDYFVKTSKAADGKVTRQFRAPAIGLALGGAGALTVMLSRGRYDEHEMQKGVPSVMDKKYQRMDKYQQSIRGQIRDIRNSGDMEGIALGSRERQAQRYSSTDFGSGLVKAGVKALGKAKGAVKAGKAIKQGTGKVTTEIVETLMDASGNEVGALTKFSNKLYKKGGLFQKATDTLVEKGILKKEPLNIKRTTKSTEIIKSQKVNKKLLADNKPKDIIETKAKQKTAVDKATAQKIQKDIYKYKKRPQELPPYIQRRGNDYFFDANTYREMRMRGQLTGLGSTNRLPDPLTLGKAGVPISSDITQNAISPDLLQKLLGADLQRGLGISDKRFVHIKNNLKATQDFFDIYKYKATLQAKPGMPAVRTTTSNIYTESNVNKIKNLVYNEGSRNTIGPGLGESSQTMNHLPGSSAGSKAGNTTVGSSGLHKPGKRAQVDLPPPSNTASNPNAGDIPASSSSKRTEMMSKGNRAADNLTSYKKGEVKHGSSNLPIS